MQNRTDIATALLVLIPLSVGYIIGLRTQRQQKWSPKRHTRSHW